MKEKVFVDTNIFVYLKLRDEKNRDKKSAAENLFKKIKERIIISSQVINEFYSVMLRNKISDSKIQEMIREIVKISRMSHITFDTILKSWEIREKHKYSIWDSLIAASALENGCKILYSEDMHHNHLIEKKLRIVNPFIAM